eukprot:g8658.t1
MDVWVVLITTVLLWGSLHLRFTRKDWANLRRWASMERQVVDALKEARVKEEMDSLSVTPAQLKLITWFLHFLQLPLIASSICSATAFDFAVRQGLQTVSRFGLGILFLDPWVSIPFQLVHSAAEFAVHLSYFEMHRVHMGLLLIAQFFTFAIHIACMAFIDVVLRQRINAQLETADAESLVSSFRRMLRSVCDGEVLLDGQMNVAQESEGLKHLILTTVNLKGRSFERLLIDEECTRFTKFIQSSTEAFLTPKPAVPPVCLRTSLRGSAGIRVAADVFHVPIPGLFGAAEPYHLLAFKEDTESRAHPEANEDSVPAELLSRQPRQAHRPGSRPGSTSMLSGSTGRSSCHGFPGLDEVFLLIDVDSQLQEVTQVELNFKRDRCAASMPSLGKLVRPSEWEKVRSSVARFAEKSSRDQSDHPKVLKRLTLQVPGQSGLMLVDEATLHRSQQPWKLWMHLHGFHPRKTLRFLVSVAAELVYPNYQLRGGHTLGDGFLYQLEGGEDSEAEVEAIRKKLTELVDSGETICRVTKPWKKAMSYFTERRLDAACALLTSRVKTEVQCYECQNVLRLNLFPLHEKASALKAGTFALVRRPEMPGFVAAYTGEYKLQSALLISHTDHKAFCKGYKVRSIGDLNQLSQVGRGRKDFVLACEFRQETKIAEIVAKVKERMAAGRQVKVICIAGPTSSGKTTFATKLCMYLQNNGFAAKPLTVDHYYLPLDRQPKYQDPRAMSHRKRRKSSPFRVCRFGPARKQRSDVDYDHIESMDVQLICEHLNALIVGESVMTPVYNMKTGYRDGDGHKFDALPANGTGALFGVVSQVNTGYSRS